MFGGERSGTTFPGADPLGGFASTCATWLDPPTSADALRSAGRASASAAAARLACHAASVSVGPSLWAIISITLVLAVVAGWCSLKCGAKGRLPSDAIWTNVLGLAPWTCPDCITSPWLPLLLCQDIWMILELTGGLFSMSAGRKVLFGPPTLAITTAAAIGLLNGLPGSLPPPSSTPSS